MISKFLTLRKILAKNIITRAIFIPFLRNFNFSIKWKHDVTKRPFILKTWSHKGYWFYGKHREYNEINRFKEFINKNDCVIDIGSHIGYTTQIFEELVGENGTVFAAEPTPRRMAATVPMGT